MPQVKYELCLGIREIQSENEQGNWCRSPFIKIIGGMERQEGQPIGENGKGEGNISRLKINTEDDEGSREKQSQDIFNVRPLGTDTGGH